MHLQKMKLVGVKPGEMAPQNHFLTAKVKVAA
jgi:hypothetical protein